MQEFWYKYMNAHIYFDAWILLTLNINMSKQQNAFNSSFIFINLVVKMLKLWRLDI